MNRLLTLLTILILFCFKPAQARPCHGKFPNLVTDVCWTCMFPMRIGSIKLNVGGQLDNGDASPPLICACPAPPPFFIRPGIGFSFWQPARMAEVVRTPMCSPTLGGIKLGSFKVSAGDNNDFEGDGDDTPRAFYHVHWFNYPVLGWLGMGFNQSVCMKNETFDVAYMSELDPLWDSDELTFLLNPEAVLFSNPLAQAACVADAVQATATGFGIDRLHWCAGSQGSVYPMSGYTAEHSGGVSTSLTLLHRFIFKMHRQGLGRDTSTHAAMCGSQPQPILRKRQYKQQMMYPVAQSKRGYGLGKSSITWDYGKEYPYKGEDFAYLVWRKEQCCAL